MTNSGSVPGLKRLLPSNEFVRSVVVLVGGTAGAQVITVAASPLLTRLYTPENFGVLAVFSALLAVLGVIASLRYQLAIPLPESDEEAGHVVGLSIGVVIIMAMLTAGIVLPYAQPIADVLGTPILAEYMWLVPTGLLLMGLYQVFNFWAIRVKAFPAIAKTRLMQSSGMVLIQLAAYSLGPAALLAGKVFGSAAGAASLGRLTIGSRFALLRNIKLRQLTRIATRYRRFPIYSTWAGGFNSAGQQLPPLLLAALFSTSAAGIYMLAERVMAMPLSLIGQSVANVFYPHAVEAKREGTLAEFVASIHGKLAHIGMPPALILIVAGPELFTFVFGENWTQAGQFAQLMAPYLYVRFITSPLSQLTSVLDKLRQGMIFQGSLFASRLVGLMIGAYFHDMMFAIVLYCLASLTCWVGYLVWLIRASGNYLAASCWSTLGASLWSIPIVAPVLLSHIWDIQTTAWFACLGAAGIILIARYYVLFNSAHRSMSL